MAKKTIIFAILGISLAGVLTSAYLFYQANLRGIWPAVKNPPEDITKVINTTDMPLELAPNLAISIFAKDLEAPRVLILGPNGILLSSITSAGKVIALFDEDNNGVSEKRITVAENLNRPHGLALKCRDENSCKLYIAESDNVSSYDLDSENMKAINKKKIVDLPNGGRHFTRTIMFMPKPNDDKLLISVGSSCDVCHENDWRRAKVLVVDSDGGNLRAFSSGLRNSVFMAINPLDGKVWATEMGRDFLGDDLPPDEINIIEDGKDYGWPICYGKNIHDDVFDKNVYIQNPCQDPFKISSYIDIPAHSAPLGLAFIPEEGWTEEYRHNLLVAYHGSWNRSDPAGYKIVRYKLDGAGNYLESGDFISGWLARDGALGRPVDILALPKGILYISDDKAGVIYKATLSD